MNNRKEKIIIISLLIGLVICVGIGFAAFSSTLKVSSSAGVTPDSSTFSVKFSSNAQSLETNNIVATKSSSEIEATDAVINNNLTYPTISNLGATFKKPGDKITYEFYALNTGKYVAYLNSIVYNGSPFKECLAGTGTSEELTSRACESIKVTVNVGNTETASTQLNISNNSIDIGESQKVTITIEYLEGGARADGYFSVVFDYIYLTYSTAETFDTPELPDAPACIVSNDLDANGEPDIGDTVACGGEYFYVIPNDPISHPEAVTGKISLLAMNRIMLEEEPKQAIVFSMQKELFATYPYWYDNGIKPEYGGTYPTFVYDENSATYPYIEGYKNYLINKLNVNVISATLPSYEQAVQLGCDPTTGSCENAQYLIYHTTMWLGTLGSENGIWTVGSDYSFAVRDYNTPNYGSIRPVIIVNESEIG